MPTPETTIPITRELLQLTLVAMHRHETALSKVRELIDRDYCPLRAEVADALLQMKTDRQIRAKLQAILAMTPEPE